MKSNIHVWSYLAHFFLEWEMLQTEVVETIKTHFMFGIFFFLENRAGYEIMCKSIVEPDGPQMTIWSMRVAAGYPRP
jgi:hypothetical protein